MLIPSAIAQRERYTFERFVIPRVWSRHDGHDNRALEHDGLPENQDLEFNVGLGAIFSSGIRNACWRECPEDLDSADISG